MIHAGILPQWTIEEAIGSAREVETVLAGPTTERSFKPLSWAGPTMDPSLKGPESLVSITRVLTRLRTCTPTGEMSGFSGPPDQTPAGFSPGSTSHIGAIRMSPSFSAIGRHWGYTWNPISWRLIADVYGADS